MNLYFVAFLIIPILALAAKEFGTLKLSRWSIFFIYVAAGWLLVHFAVVSHFTSLDEIVRNAPNPSEELLSEWENDGAPQVFALLFGWAYAAIYFLVCFSVVELVRAIRKKN
jgi:hypothetical protein